MPVAQVEHAHPNQAQELNVPPARPGTKLPPDRPQGSHAGWPANKRNSAAVMVVRQLITERARASSGATMDNRLIETEGGRWGFALAFERSRWAGSRTACRPPAVWL